MSPPAGLPENYSGLELDFHTLANHVPQLAWMAQSDGFLFWYNQRWYDYTGTTLEQVRGWGWSIVHDPAHVDRVREGFISCLESGEPWEDTFPLKRHDGEWRWFLSRALPVRDQNNKVLRWFGTNTDITEQKDAEERHLRLMREIDHRAKNALAVAHAIVKLSSGETIDDYRMVVEARIAALSRAHMLLADRLWKGIDLRTAINTEMAAHNGEHGRVWLHGEDMLIDSSFAQPLGLLLNELFMNARRFGPLSHGDATGTLCIAWHRNSAGKLEIDWNEQGARQVIQPAKRGFGLTMMERIVRQQLGGAIETEWNAGGVHYLIAIPTPANSHPPDGISAAEAKMAPPPARR